LGKTRGVTLELTSSSILVLIPFEVSSTPTQLVTLLLD